MKRIAMIALLGVASHEPSIEVVHQVRRPPVQVRRQRGHVRGEHPRDHDTEKAVRQDQQVDAGVSGATKPAR